MIPRLVWTELKLLAREPVTLFVSLTFPLLLLVLLVGPFGDDPSAEFGGLAGADFYVPVYLAAVIAAMGFLGVPTHLAVAFAASGVLLGALLPSARAAQGLGMALFFGLFFIAGGIAAVALLAGVRLLRSPRRA